MSRPSKIGRPMAASTMIQGGGKKSSGLPSRVPSKTMVPKQEVPTKTKVATSSIPPQPSKTTFKMPAFSVPEKKKLTNKEVEKLKKKMIRRNKPEGEDVEKLKQICKELKGESITIEEFIALVTPSLGDNGELLRNIMFQELSVFRETTRNIYETMTQDISEVLTNEHIQITNRCKENEEMYKEMKMRTIKELFQYIPDFEFKDYYSNVDYLKDKFPPAKGHDDMDPEQREAMLRQEAYHRYQWLKSEGERLKQENSKLQGRFNQLKKQQRDEIKMISQREEKAEVDREILEKKQEELEDKLEDLNKSIEKSIVEGEKAMAQDTIAKMTKVPQKETRGRKQQTRRKPPNEEWAAQAAAEIETTAASQELMTEAVQEVQATASKGAIKKTKIKRKSKRDKSPFHFSPIKSPQASREPERPDSPFHYSPVRERQQERRQPERPASPFHYSPEKTLPPQVQYVPEDFQTSMARGGPPTPRQAPPPVSKTAVPNLPRRQRGSAPRDSWGGFY